MLFPWQWWGRKGNSQLNPAPCPHTQPTPEPQPELQPELQPEPPLNSGLLGNHCLPLLWTVSPPRTFPNHNLGSGLRDPWS